VSEEKRKAALGILSYSWLTVHLRTNEDHSDLVIPAHLKRAKFIALQFGIDMPVPIPDMRVLPNAISGTLSYGGVSFWTSVPWSVIYAMSDQNGRGQVWPDDSPNAVRSAKLGLRLVKGSCVLTTPARGVLRLVEN